MPAPSPPQDRHRKKEEMPALHYLATAVRYWWTAMWENLIDDWREWRR